MCCEPISPAAVSCLPCQVLRHPPSWLDCALLSLISSIVSIYTYGFCGRAIHWCHLYCSSCSRFHSSSATLSHTPSAHCPGAENSPEGPEGWTLGNKRNTAQWKWKAGHGYSHRSCIGNAVQLLRTWQESRPPIPPGNAYRWQRGTDRLLHDIQDRYHLYDSGFLSPVPTTVYRNVLFYTTRCKSYCFNVEILICGDYAVAVPFKMPSNIKGA